MMRVTAWLFVVLAVVLTSCLSFAILSLFGLDFPPILLVALVGVVIATAKMPKFGKAPWTYDKKQGRWSYEPPTRKAVPVDPDLARKLFGVTARENAGLPAGILD
jgi:hypothetical protein